MNLPVFLTLARIVLVIPFVAAFFIDGPIAKIVALVIFIVASATDFVDGRLARKRKQVTELGKFLDPLADKMLINLAFLSLVYIGTVPFFMFAIILVRDFAVDGIRMMAARNKITIAASIFGKLKTTMQMIAIISILFNLILQNDILAIINIVLLYIMLVLTIFSGLDYLIKGKKLLKV